VIRRLLNHKHDAASVNTLAAFFFGLCREIFDALLGFAALNANLRICSCLVLWRRCGFLGRITRQAGMTRCASVNPLVAFLFGLCREIFDALLGFASLNANLRICSRLVL